MPRTAFTLQYPLMLAPLRLSDGQGHYEAQDASCGHIHRGHARQENVELPSHRSLDNAVSRIF